MAKKKERKAGEPFDDADKYEDLAEAFSNKNKKVLKKWDKRYEKAADADDRINDKHPDKRATQKNEDKMRGRYEKWLMKKLKPIAKKHKVSIKQLAIEVAEMNAEGDY